MTTDHGGRARAFDSIEVGEKLPPIEIPITLQRLVMEAGANRDFSLIHHDNEVARATGAPAAFANTYFLLGMFERLVRQWIGPRARLRKMGPLRMMVFNAVGDEVSFFGRVSSVDPESRELSVEMWAESSRGKTVTCSALLVDPG